MLKQAELSPHYQLEVWREGHLDKLDIRVELKPEFANAGTHVSEQAARELQHHIKSYIGISTRVRVEAVGSIERAVGGKARRVVDKRPQ